MSCDFATLERVLWVLVEYVCQFVRKDGVKKKINYREEEIPDCGCIYG